MFFGLRCWQRYLDLSPKLNLGQGSESGKAGDVPLCFVNSSQDCPGGTFLVSSSTPLLHRRKGGVETWPEGGVSLGVGGGSGLVQPGPLAIALWDSKLMGRNKGASSNKGV